MAAAASLTVPAAPSSPHIATRCGLTQVFNTGFVTSHAAPTRVATGTRAPHPAQRVANSPATAVEAEARQTFDPVLLIELVPAPDCVAVEQQYFSDRLTAHSFVQQHQRIGTAGQPVRGGTVASQLNQVAARFAVQEARVGSWMKQNRLTVDWQGLYPDFAESEYTYQQLYRLIGICPHHQRARAHFDSISRFPGHMTRVMQQPIVV